MIKLKDALIAWSPAKSGRWEHPVKQGVGVGHLIARGERDWTDGNKATGGYVCTAGAAYTAWSQLSDGDRLMELFHLFVVMTVKEGIPAETVHTAFSEIEEYRASLPSGYFPELQTLEA